MPDDLKIVTTLVGGFVGALLLWFWAATRPINSDKDDAYDDGVDEVPEHPEDEARRRQF